MNRKVNVGEWSVFTGQPGGKGREWGPPISRHIFGGKSCLCICLSSDPRACFSIPREPAIPDSIGPFVRFTVGQIWMGSRRKGLRAEPHVLRRLYHQVSSLWPRASNSGALRKWTRRLSSFSAQWIYGPGPAYSPGAGREITRVITRAAGRNFCSGSRRCSFIPVNKRYQDCIHIRPPAMNGKSGAPSGDDDRLT